MLIAISPTRLWKTNEKESPQGKFRHTFQIYMFTVEHYGLLFGGGGARLFTFPLDK